MHRPVESGLSSHDAAISFAEAADYLGLSQAALIRVLERGELAQTTESPAADPLFLVEDLENFLEEQRDRAALTGKLTMPLQMSIDVPSLLSSMVRMRDEREAAEGLATELCALAGSRCPAVAILRVDEVMQTVRLLALSDFPGRESFSITSDRLDTPVEVDVTKIEGSLRTAAVDNKSFDTTDAHSILEPVMGAEAAELCQLLNLRGTIVYPLLRIGSVRWMIALLLEGDPLEVRPEKRDAIEALGIQASIALEAVRLRGDVLHRANRAEALYGTVRMLARSEDSGSLLDRISSQAARLLQSDAAVVLIYDEEREEFRPGARTGLDETSVNWTANLSSAYLAGRAAGMTRPLQITDASLTTTLNMPRLTGNRRAMAAICAPIIHRGSLLGAIEVYSAKPRSFSEDDMSLLSAFAHQAAIAIHSVRTQENRRRALLGAVEALASANEARDGYTGEHCKRLAQLAVLIARRLGFAEDEVDRIGLAAALHDIGKIAVPDAILRKPGPLTPEEREVINLHPTTGEEIVARVPELQEVAVMIGAHQERFDGSGYPRGLVGKDIPAGARIISVVDTYAALIEDRPYRKGASHEDAIKEMQRCAGSQLDPEIVAAFADMGDAIKQLMAETDELDLLATQSPIEIAHIERVVGQQEHGGRVVPISSVMPGSHWEMHRASELAAINDIIRTIATSRDLRKMYEQVQRKLSDLIDVDAMMILLSDGTPAGQRQLPELRQAPFFAPLGIPVEEGINAPVARLKRPLWVSDYVEFATERNLEIDLTDTADLPRSIIAVPIVVEDQFIGLLSVQALHPEAYDKRHVGLIEEIALHIGLILRNSREYALIVQNAGHELRPATPVQIGERLGTYATPEEIAIALVNEIQPVVSYDGCQIYLLQQGEPVLAASAGFYSEQERRAYAAISMPRGMGYIWEAIESGESYIVDNLAEDYRVSALVRPPVLGESAVAAPMVHNGEVSGVIFLRRVSEPFSTDDEILLNDLAIAGAAAIDSLKSRTSEQQHIRELESLQRAVSLVGGSVDRDAALKALVDSLGSIYGYRMVSIYLLEGPDLVLHSRIGTDQLVDRLPLDRGVMGRVVREGKPILIDNVHASVDALDTTPGVVSQISVPVYFAGLVAGVLNVSSGRERRMTDWDMTLVQLFAQQAGVALAHVTRLQETVEAALIDTITDLPNQGAFIQRLRHEVDQANRTSQPVSLLFLDLDHFKMANDAFGHRFGDELLAWLGEFLPRSLPLHAWLARYGGEEFVVILPKTPVDNAEWLAEELRREMDERTFDTSLGHKVRLSMSIGVAAIEPGKSNISTADELIDAADRAMYAAKVRGRNRVVRWTPAVAEFLQTKP